MLKPLAWLILASGAIFAQAPMQFDVASIRPAGSLAAQASSGKFHVGMSIDKARVDIGSMSLMDLICKAYDVKPYQVVGPDWMKSQRWDILAKMPDGATKDQVPQMLQALLADRFKLTVHRDDKEEPVYALIVGKNGPKLKESPPDPPKAADAAPPADGDKKSNMVIATDQGNVSVSREGRGAVVRGGPMGTTRISMGQNGVMHMEADKMTMAGFADMLSRFTDHPVVDQTNLKGTYQVAVDVSMEDIRNAARAAGMPILPGGRGGEAGKDSGDAASDPSGGSVFSTVQQLGLKLEARKLPLGRVVVDHLEKTPTEN